MKLVIQRVQEASVEVENKIVGKIGKGFLVLFGASANDTESDCVRLAEKVAKLRIFEDENGKTNLDLKAVDGEILCISQFTLLADCSHGNRPSFVNAAPANEANRLYELFMKLLDEKGFKVEKGIFGADMKVRLLNDGPFTIALD